MSPENMTDKLSPAELAKEIRRLSEAATKGPWTLEVDEYEEDSGEIAIFEINRLLHNPDWAEPEDWKRDLANGELIVYLRTHAEQIAEALESKHHWSCRSVMMGDLCDCEARRIADLEAKISALEDWRRLLESAPGESAQVIRERCLSAGFMAPIVDAWKAQVADLKATLERYREEPPE